MWETKRKQKGKKKAKNGEKRLTGKNRQGANPGNRAPMQPKQITVCHGCACIIRIIVV